MKRTVATTEWRSTQRPIRRALFRTSSRDVWVVFAAFLQTIGLVTAVSLAITLGSFWLILLIPAVAVGTWWGANTVSHIHLHAPVFGSRKLNKVFFWWLTISLGIPQTLWKRRHFWHHAGEPAGKRPGWDKDSLVEAAVILAVWALFVVWAPLVFVAAYLPGYLIALVLCQFQGYHEHHALGQTFPDGISTYGKLHNWLWFNDGYHAEHHRWPAEHWTRLPIRHQEMTDHRTSPFSPMLRWMEHGDVAPWGARVLSRLEKLALLIGPVQQFLIRRHTCAFARLTQTIPDWDPQGILIVGGGLFPRSVLVARALWPNAHIQVVDQDVDHIERAKRYLNDNNVNVSNLLFRADVFDPSAQSGADLVVLPLAYVGDRASLYIPRPDGAYTLVHDWWHTRRGLRSTPISIWVWKRLTLVAPELSERSP